MSEALDTFKNWFSQLTEEEQKEILDALFAEISKGLYIGPSGGMIKEGAYLGPSPSSHKEVKVCPGCNRPF